MSFTFLVLAVCLAAAAVQAQGFKREGNLAASLASLDTGPRKGFVPAPNAYPGFPTNPGNPIQGLSPGQAAAFGSPAAGNSPATGALAQFIEVEPVNLIAGAGNGGLGPTYNSDSCGSCHSQPATGGTSPSMKAFPFVGNIAGQNPQFTAGQKNGGTNTIPFFVTANGPVREARFKSDGGVHDLFTIQGRTDVSNTPGDTTNNCTLPQPGCAAGTRAPQCAPFAAEAARGNLSFRIPTPVFGAGLIENIDEGTLTQNLAKSSSVALGIHGTFNRSGNDGSITRFGWKAQNKSLLVFAGEAYNVEMGITNELFPNERGVPPDQTANCLLNPTPEDLTVFDSSPTPTTPSVPQLSLSDVEQFAVFMRFLDQPAPACGGNSGITCSQQIQSGSTTFTNIGCANCHTPTMKTTTSEFAPAALSGVQANLFSDLALHHMGSGLADGITQGNAGPDQFRTSPLWGVGQRVFFLHDGRTANLAQAILDHESPGSEANRVVETFEGLSMTDQQSLILFLRSL